MPKTHWHRRIIAYMIIGVFIGAFLVISYALFAITPREYFWLVSILVVIIMSIGVIILSKIPFTEK